MRDKKDQKPKGNSGPKSKAVPKLSRRPSKATGPSARRGLQVSNPSSKTGKATARSHKGDSQTAGLGRHAPEADREAYLQLFLQNLPALDRFVRHNVRYAEKTGIVERGLIDPCAIVDQVYIAALADIKKKPEETTFGSWLRYLALHITRQQIRLEHNKEPSRVSLELPWRDLQDPDSALWEFYQPDDIASVADVTNDRTAADPALMLEQRETETEIKQWIEELAPELREALQLRLLEGLNATEIAARKNQSTDDIRQAIREACAAVRERANRASA